MTGNIRAPQRGDPFLSTWAQQITAGVNAFCAVGPSRGLVRDGFGGIGFEPLPENRRGIKAGIGVLPFTLRHVEQDSDAGIPYTGWEIYMPTGCVSIGSTCLPMNPPAYRVKDGDDVNEPGWFRLPAPDKDPSDGDIWYCVAHAKTCSAISEVDEIESWPKGYVWAEIHDKNREDVEADEDTSDIGDMFSSVVDEVSWSEDEDGNVVNACLNTIKGPIHVRADGEKTEPFRLEWVFEVDEDELKIELKNLYLRNLAFSAAGASFVSYEMHEIEKTTEDVYLKIDTATRPYQAEVKEYKNLTVNGETLTIPEQIQQEATPTDLMLLLYRFDGKGRVKGNMLSTLQNIQMYS